MKQLTVLNDIPAHPAWKEALDAELRRVLDPYPGPWTVRLRPVEPWQGGEGWSVEVIRPGHVWTLRVSTRSQEPSLLARQIEDAVQPDRFKEGDGT